MSQTVQTVGCDSCGYYVEFERYNDAKEFVEQSRKAEPFGCRCEGLAVVRRSKDLDFR